MNDSQHLINHRNFWFCKHLWKSYFFCVTYVTQLWEALTLRNSSIAVKISTQIKVWAKTGKRNTSKQTCIADFFFKLTKCLRFLLWIVTYVTWNGPITVDKASFCQNCLCLIAGLWQYERSPTVDVLVFNYLHACGSCHVRLMQSICWSLISIGFSRPLINRIMLLYLSAQQFWSFLFGGLSSRLPW